MTYPPVLQYAAGLCFAAAKGDTTEATRAFRSLCTRANVELPKNPWEFVTEWGPKLQSDGTIQSGAKLSGQKRKMTDDDGRVVWAQALDWFDQGLPGPYGSAQDLISKSKKVKAIAEATGASAKTITRAIKQIDPYFKYGKYYKKAFLHEQHRDARIQGCELNKPIVERSKALILRTDEKVL